MSTDAVPEASEPAQVAQRRRLWAACQVAIGIGLLVWLLQGVELSELTALLGRGDRAGLVIGFALLLSALPLLQALRLHVLVVPYTRRLATSFEVFFVGAFFNNFLPSNLGGDAVRLLYLRRLATSNWGGPLAMLLLHRASSFAVLLAGALVSVPLRQQALAGAFRGSSTPAWLAPVAFLGVAGAALCVVVLVALPRVRERLWKLARRLGGESLGALRQTSPRALAGLLVLSILFHAARMLGVIALLGALGQSAHALDVVIALAVSGFAVVLPLSVGGLGVMEGALSVTLVAFGVSETAAIAVALVNRTVLLLNAALGGLVYVASRRALRRAP